MKTFRYALTAIAAVGLIAVANAASAQKAVELKLGFWTPPEADTNKLVLQPWIQAITDSSKGTLNPVWYKGEILGNARTIYDNIVNGVADVGWVIPTQVPGRMQKLSVAGLPYLAEGLDVEQISLALWRTYKSGAFESDFKDTIPLALNVTPTALLHTNFPIQKLEDLQGKKLNAVSQVTFLKTLGATPVPIAISDLNQSIQRGVIDGTAMPWMGTDLFRVLDVTQYHVLAGWNSGYTAVLMNRKMFDGLPADGRAAIEKHSGEALTLGYAKIFNKDDVNAREIAQKDAKHKISTLPEAETARWRKIAQPITDEWVSKTPDGAQVLAAFRAELDKVRAGK